MYFRGVHNLQRGRSGLVALTGCYGAGDQSLFVVVFFSSRSGPLSRLITLRSVAVSSLQTDACFWFLRDMQLHAIVCCVAPNTILAARKNPWETPPRCPWNEFINDSNFERHMWQPAPVWPKLGKVENAVAPLLKSRATVERMMHF